MKNNLCIKILVVICFLMFAPSFAEPQSKKESRNGIDAIQAFQEGDYLQELKDKDLKAYDLVLKEIQLAKEIDSIVASFHDGKITEPQARFNLTPLVRKSLEQQLNYLDEEIKETNQRLEYLKKIKHNPKILIEEEIDRHLGKIHSQESTAISP